ncbi:MAG: hypothetical protein KAJ75_05685 [Alphaproteobacteria bacterium]|nr:hypothetical protein [Alphaproteobacteria bacterium]
MSNIRYQLTTKVQKRIDNPSGELLAAINLFDKLLRAEKKVEMLTHKLDGFVAIMPDKDTEAYVEITTELQKKA